MYLFVSGGIIAHMKIVVLGGGISSERNVAQVTATSVCRALRSLGHKAIYVDIFEGLESWEGTLEDAFEAEDGLIGDVAIVHEAPDIPAVIAGRKDKSLSRLGKNVLEICRLADCVFLGLHGKDGEDGKIQATLDLLGVPYTGSDYLGSAIAMNKPYAKQVMLCNGIPTPEYTDRAPCVVKEVDGGSSLGTWICRTDEEMQAALAEAKNTVIIEAMKVGREFTVPVLDGKALSVIEIVSPSGQFDYVAKYQSGSEGASEICPAPITEEEKNLLQSLAVKFHNALGLKIYSRVDFILDTEGNPWCLEVNTLPGMTPNSLIPKAAALEGLSYPELCQKIIDLSLKK